MPLRKLLRSRASPPDDLSSSDSCTLPSDPNGIRTWVYFLAVSNNCECQPARSGATIKNCSHAFATGPLQLDQRREKR